MPARRSSAKWYETRFCGLPTSSHELADPAIAAAELDDQLPSQRIAQQPEDLRRLRSLHACYYIRSD